MKFGIIGAGRIGKIHGGNVAARPDSEVVCVADADPAAAAALAKATGAKVAAVDAILAAKDVDAVAICSPTDTHADLIERAARARKAIFCEKPIDLDVDRVRACLEVVKTDRRDADGRLQSPVRPEFRFAAPAHRRGRDRRARDRLDHLARSRRRRHSPISPARAASSAT